MHSWTLLTHWKCACDVLEVFGHFSTHLNMVELCHFYSIFWINNTYCVWLIIFHHYAGFLQLFGIFAICIFNFSASVEYCPHFLEQTNPFYSWIDTPPPIIDDMINSHRFQFIWILEKVIFDIINQCSSITPQWWRSRLIRLSHMRKVASLRRIKPKAFPSPNSWHWPVTIMGLSDMTSNAYMSG
jgi:hypothetical protein